MPLDQHAGAARDTVRTENATAVPTNAKLRARLCCPNCDSSDALVLDPSAALKCPDCAKEYPIYASGEACIPWLFANPDTARLEWNARYRGFLKANECTHNRLNRALADTQFASATRHRISHTQRSHREHRRQVETLLSAFGLDGDDLVPAMTRVLQENLPRNQSLMSYADNVFRDWAWNNGENDALLDAVDAVLSADQRDEIGSVLTLGAGACRLPYDIHNKYAPTLSVALDLNPLLMIIASHVIQGRPVPLYEFPTAPLDGGSVGVLQHCSAPLVIDADAERKFECVLGDATNPPFMPQSFDTVVTPWLIDILPRDLREFIPCVNRLLPKDGVWVNTGSLVFLDDDPCRCYCEDEVFKIVEECGFELMMVDHRTVPYLQSPHSAHGRVERILSFAARKRDDVETAPPASLLPDWILDTTRSVPSNMETTLASSSYLLSAQVLAAVDGKRSINAIGKLVAREYDLSMDECIHAIKRILTSAERTVQRHD